MPRPKPPLPLTPERLTVSAPQAVVIAALRHRANSPTKYRDVSQLFTRALEELMDREAPGLVAQVHKEIDASPLDYSENVPLQIRAFPGQGKAALKEFLAAAKSSRGKNGTAAASIQGAARHRAKASPRRG